MTLAPADTQQLLVEKIVKLQKNCARRQVIIWHWLNRIYALSFFLKKIGSYWLFFLFLSEIPDWNT